MSGNGDSGMSRGAVSRSTALHQLRNVLAEEYFEHRNNTRSISPFDEYDPKEWDHTYSNQSSGGLVVTSLERIPKPRYKKGKLRPPSTQELRDFKKEQDTSRDLADMGHRIVHLSDKNRPAGQTYDILFDDMPADLKSVSSWKQIQSHTGNAQKRQGAKVVVFRLENHDPNMMEGFRQARNWYKEIKILYYYMGEKTLHEYK